MPTRSGKWSLSLQHNRCGHTLSPAISSDVNDPTNPARRALIVGCGYLGQRVAGRLLTAGWQVAATTRNPLRARQLGRQGVQPVLADWTDPASLMGLPPHDRLLVAVAYDRRSNVSRYESQVLGFRNLLEATDPLADLCYISTTGVYHQGGGQWVDETSPCAPLRESGRVHLEAEELLAAERGSEGLGRRNREGGQAARWCVLRLAGIYGPDRIPRARDVVAGRPIETHPDTYLNLIHVEDAAGAVMAAWDAGPVNRGRYYVVADGVPVLRGEFYGEIARITGSDSPQFVLPPGTENASAADRSGGNKRIWNDRMQRDLVPRLQFPGYQAGLRSILG